MAFDQGTRNRLAGLVGAARAKLVQEFTRQLQGDYGLDPATGAAADLDSLRHLDDAGRETARILRETWRHYLAAAPRDARDGRDAKAQRDALDRIVREQAFTVLNRLCALRMAEARGLLIESVGRGHDSRGFALYRNVAGPALGETGDAYRAYLFSVFDEFAVDLPALFDRYSPQGRLFPRDTVLRELLALLNAPEIEPLWAEDETIGWVYQYFNSVEERRQMRAESAAPRNSRELAVRNQFFTPRYVVEFLTDNTLGRIWYEMTRGETALVDACRYLVRRPLEIFLRGDISLVDECRDWVRRVMAGEWAALADDPTEMELAAVALLIDGYEVAPRLGIHDLPAWARPRIAAFERTGVLPASSLELWLLFFGLQREWRIITGSGPAGRDFLSLWRRVYHELKAALLNPPADLSQEELLRQPVYIPHRPPKDPRDIKLLDPACGSMHFGLYAFDLFERIYDEAWAIEAGRGPRALARPDGLAPLSERYADEAAFRRDVPRLILAHNLHGIDIDPRAVQIAGLSLWLRAQRSWRDQGVVAAERPAITRSHVVCAEPMPGEREMLDEFVKNLPHQIVGELVVKVFDEMKLAGEAGALLKIEETLRGAIDAARAAYDAELLRRQDAGYPPGLAPERTTTLLDLMELPDPEAFWETLEEQVLAALRDFATINGDGSYQRRLFADDAARGFAFIDLCRQRYDVVVMNPPFGAVATSTEAYLAHNYVDSKGDILQAFVERAAAILSPRSFVGAITSRTPFFLGQSEAWRTQVLFQLFKPYYFVDLGAGVLEAAVETMAYVLRTLSVEEDQAFVRHLAAVLPSVETNRSGWFTTSSYRGARGQGLKNSQAQGELERLTNGGYVARVEEGTNPKYHYIEHTDAHTLPIPQVSNHILLCFRLIEDIEKEDALLELTQGGVSKSRYLASTVNLLKIPGVPLAYWVSHDVTSLFGTMGRFDRGGRKTEQGLSTKDDYRFIRSWLETPLERLSPGEVNELHEDGNTHNNTDYVWFRLNRAVPYDAYLTRIDHVVNWADNGREIEADVLRKYPYLNGDANWVLHRDCDYFSPGLTFSRRARRFSPKPVPEGCLFTETGQMVFAKRDSLLWLSAFLGSDIVRSLLGLVAPPRKIELRYVNLLPVPLELEKDVAERLEAIQRFRIDKSQLAARKDETHCTFVTISQTQQEYDEADPYFHEVNDLVCEALGILEHDKASLLRELSASTGLAADRQRYETELVDDNSEEQDEGASVHETSKDVFSNIVSYSVGCAFGRWDIRYATGQRQPPELPDPFAPLPVCPPGMLQNAAGLPAAPEDVSPDYPLRISWPGILVDDEGHPEDVVGRVRQALGVIWPSGGETTADAIEAEACAILGVASLGDYFARPDRFFADHLSRYSKSRRAAPIYWPLSSANGAYTVWLYYHRLNDQTLYHVVNDFVDPKLRRTADDAARLRARGGRSRAEERELERLVDLEAELKSFREELLRVAGFWRPNLNDGVEITAAPLWRLFRHRPWQKRLRQTWEKLEAGDYDWAHLAYAIWPDRVREKCAGDKSLAIAHDLEHLYVAPPNAPRKKRRATATADEEETADVE